jgi:hypothetical protein
VIRVRNPLPSLSYSRSSLLSTLTVVPPTRLAHVCVHAFLCCLLLGVLVLCSCQPLGALKMRTCGLRSPVTSLAVSSHHQHASVWCGTLDGRVARLDAKTLHFSANTKVTHTLPRGIRTALATANALWCGTSQDIVAFDLQVGVDACFVAVCICE